MYKLQYLNIIIETDSEMRKNELMSIGYELVDEVIKLSFWQKKNL